MRSKVADELEAFLEVGALWDPAMSATLIVEETTAAPSAPT